MARDRGPSRTRPKFNSLVAAAEVMTSPHPVLQRAAPFSQADWQQKAWDYYDTVGELGFGVNWLANGMSRVNLIAAAPPDGPGDEPRPLSLDDEGLTPSQRRAIELVTQIAGGPSGQGMMLHGFGTHLTVAGQCWVVAEPDARRTNDGVTPVADGQSWLDPEADEFVTWDVLSADELRRQAGDGVWTENGRPKVEIREGNRWRELHPNTLIIKAWKRHPRNRALPDAPTRRCLSVLALIDSFTLRLHADAQSRLAGAGLLLLPTEASFPKSQLKPLGLTQPDPESGELTPGVDDYTPEPEDDDMGEILVELMVTPIGDRASPAAVVPGMLKMPGAYIKDVRHLSFATPFDEKIGELLELNVKRFALGMDLPPEIVTGVADVNHWTAWQVNETAITIHIEPLAEVSANALSVGFVEPVIRAEGLLDEGAPADFMVWYDTTDLRSRPDKSGNAAVGHAAFVVSDDALVRELGLSIEGDKPDDDEVKRRTLLKFAEMNPQLALVVLVELGYLSRDLADAAMPVGAPPGGTPVEADAEAAEPEEQEPDREGVAASALVLSCSQIVDRALERAGSRLKAAAGRKVSGGAAAIKCDDPRTLHLSLDATAYSDLDFLLAGAWDRVAEVAQHCGVHEVALADQLNAYTRALLAAQQEHTYERLAQALGAYATR